MNLWEAMKARHSVRSYTDRKIEGDVLAELRQVISDCNEESRLHMQLCLDEPGAFSGMLARYGRFVNVRNYIALVGKQGDDLDEKCGYYGEKIVLKAQQLGLNTCWVAVSFSKAKCRAALSLNPDERLRMVIALGYGKNDGSPRRTKSIKALSKAEGVLPGWFRKGMEAAQLAPTARNQQRFKFILTDDIVHASAGSGFYTKVDLGIAKYHFEAGASDSGWKWAEA
ncbi:MAG: nitroreductase family protein [Christensenellales bacterium]|jgi:nitroreductase